MSSIFMCESDVYVHSWDLFYFLLTDFNLEHHEGSIDRLYQFDILVNNACSPFCRELDDNINTSLDALI